MKLSFLIILMLNTTCAFTEIVHDLLFLVACSDNGEIEVHYEFDSEEVLYIDFEKKEVVYTVPRFVVSDPSEIFTSLHLYRDALGSKNTCENIEWWYKAGTKQTKPQKNTDPPEAILYPAEEVQLGVENSLTCFVNHFYPPGILVSWTKNGHEVSEGVTLSRYYPNSDKTFHQFSTLTFTPAEGDIYTCTVEHVTLDRPMTRIWEPELSHASLGPDIYCGVGLALGLVGVAVGAFFMVKAQTRQ